MVAKISVDTDDLQYLSSLLTTLADDIHSYPFRNVGGMPNCGSSRVAEAAEAANDHFELRALLIETELRDTASMASTVAAIMEAKEDGLAGSSVAKTPHPGSGGGGGGW